MYELWGDKINEVMNRPNIAETILDRSCYYEWLEQMSGYYKKHWFKRLFVKIPKIHPLLIETFGIDKK